MIQVCVFRSANEGSILEGMVECQVRERAMQLAREEEQMEIRIRQHLGFVAELCKSSILRFL